MCTKGDGNGLHHHVGYNLRFSKAAAASEIVLGSGVLCDVLEGRASSRSMVRIRLFTS